MLLRRCDGMAPDYGVAGDVGIFRSLMLLDALHSIDNGGVGYMAMC